MKCNCIYFVIEMIELFRFCLIRTMEWPYPSEAWLSDGKNVVCMRYRLRMVSSFLSVQKFVFHVKWDFNRRDGLVEWLPAGRASRWEPGGWCWCYCSQEGVFLLRMHKHKISSEGTPQLWSWAGSCSIGDEPSRNSYPIEDEPLEEIGVYTVILE